jgi:hypothetical protein
MNTLEAASFIADAVARSRPLNIAPSASAIVAWADFLEKRAELWKVIISNIQSSQSKAEIIKLLEVLREDYWCVSWHAYQLPNNEKLCYFSTYPSFEQFH